jgi:DNA-binding transcriptional LysR family regulator
MHRDAPSTPRQDLLCPVALELRHLRLVLAIVEAGGMTKAGAYLHLTQPALSRQLRAIETRLGLTLFHRVKKRLELTASGCQVVEAARPLLGAVVELEKRLRENPSAATSR